MSALSAFFRARSRVVGLAVALFAVAVIAALPLSAAALTKTAVVTTYAGTGSPGRPASSTTTDLATFQGPMGGAVDSAGNVYVAEDGNECIRKISGSTVTLFAGAGDGSWGHSNGTSSTARFFGPSGIAIDNSDNLYVVDTYNNRIRKITPAGVVSDFSGSGAYGSANGPAGSASYENPWAICIDKTSTYLYIADTYSNLIRRVSVADGSATTFAGSGGVGASNGTSSTAKFNWPEGIAIDSGGNVYVGDTYNNEIRKITPDGTVSSIAGGSLAQGRANGATATATFGLPEGVAVDSAGNVYVADAANNEVRMISGGQVSLLAGDAGGAAGTTNGTGSAASFHEPRGLWLDASGDLLVSDHAGADIRRLTIVEMATITPTASANGTITPSTPQTVNDGADATFMITPDSGYYIATLTVDSVATTPVSPYTFTDVTTDHTIAATFKALSPVETFDHNPVLADLETPGAWYVDRYPPAGFTKYSFGGDNRLKVSISSADFQTPNDTREGESYNFNDWQGRKYDVPTVTVAAADLYVGPDWGTSTRRAGLWTTAVDSGGNITGWPNIDFFTGKGFRAWDNNGWHTVGYPDGFTYGKWYNLRIQLNPDATSVSYYIDGKLVYVSTFADDPDMVGSVGFSNVMLQAYNFGGDYDVYWDNVVPVPSATGYTITTAPGSHGTITPSNPTVDFGADATFTITPDSGYYIATLTVDSVATTPVSPYTFTDVTTDHTIAATFKALSPVETFDHNPVLAPWVPGLIDGTTSPTAGTWWVDRYPPAGFSKVTTLGVNCLKLSISAADHDPVGDLGTSGTHNDWQGRKYDVATTTVAAADLHVASDWTTGTGTFVRTALWAMAVDANGNTCSYPCLGFTNGVGFWAFDPSTGATYDIGYPDGFTYGSWYNLRVQLNPDAGTTSFYIDGKLVYVSTFASDSTVGVGNMATSVGFSQVFLQAYNYGTSYNVYWDNAVPVPPAAPYTITTTSGSHGKITPPNPTVDFGNNQTVTITADSGYHIDNVVVDNHSIGASSSVTFADVTADHSISASFAADPVVPITHTVTSSAGAHGSISPKGPQTVADGGSVTFTISHDSGYHISGVLVDGSSVGTPTAYTFTSVHGDHTIAASFAADAVVPVTHSIVPTAGAHGSISPNTTQTVADGADTTFTISADSGYHISGVRVDGSLVGTPTTYVFHAVHADHTIAASFAADVVVPVTHTITPSAGAHGSIVPSTPQTVADGADATFSIRPGAGYHVAGVLVDGVSVGHPTTYVFTGVTVDHTIAATFAWTRLKTSTTLKASAKSLKSRRFVTLTAKLHGGTFAAGTTIRFEVRRPGSTHYSLLKTVKVSATGAAKYRYRVVAKGTRYHRVRFLGNSKYLPAPIKHGIALRVK